MAVWIALSAVLIALAVIFMAQSNARKESKNGGEASQNNLAAYGADSGSDCGSDGGGCD